MFKTELYTLDDARLAARKRLPWMVFDYIDGAAGEGRAETANRAAFDQIKLQPRILNNVENRSISVEVFGKRAQLPFGISPMGMCNLAAPGADLMLADFAASHAVPHGVSTASSTSLEAIAARAQSNAWFQLYFSGDEDASDVLIDRAAAAGYEVLVLTVDVPEVGRRPRELRRGFKMPFRMGPSQFIDFACHPRWSLTTLMKGAPKLANFGGSLGAFQRTASRAGADWALFERIRKRWRGKLVVKGVLDARDAVHLKELGADAIQVSSHGGRQLESGPPPILKLAEIRSAVGSAMPIFYDSGVRSGEDIIKAYAMGADFIFLGRPFLFAIAAKGAQGPQAIADVLGQEVSICLAQLGFRDMGEVDESCLATRELRSA